MIRRKRSPYLKTLHAHPRRRPKAHLRRVKTKFGRKAVLINRDVKGKPARRRAVRIRDPLTEAERNRREIAYLEKAVTLPDLPGAVREGYEHSLALTKSAERQRRIQESKRLFRKKGRLPRRKGFRDALLRSYPDFMKDKNELAWTEEALNLPDLSESRRNDLFLTRAKLIEKLGVSLEKGEARVNRERVKFAEANKETERFEAQLARERALDLQRRLAKVYDQKIATTEGLSSLEQERQIKKRLRESRV